MTENWKRPRNYDDLVGERAHEAYNSGDLLDISEAFESGALWAAGVAEGRIDPEQPWGDS